MSASSCAMKTYSKCGNIEDAYLQYGYLECMYTGLVKRGEG